MLKLNITALIIIISLLYACDSYVGGKVVNEKNIPIQDVEVNYIETGLKTVTDKEGTYKLKYKAEKIKLEFKKLNYLSITSEFNLTDKSEKTLKTIKLIEFNSDIMLYDSKNKQRWQKNKSQKPMQWNDAKAYCDNLNIKGFNQWILPEKENYMKVLGNCEKQLKKDGSGEQGSCSICSKSLLCSRMFPEDTSYFWTATENPDNNTTAWRVNLSSGILSFFSKEFNQYHVRCIYH